MNAAIYCRVSTAGQMDGTSLESQEALCRKYAKERGYEVHRVVHEVGSGASLAERRHLSDLRDDMRRGRYKVLLAYAVDRLSRSNIQLGVILDEAERYNYTLDFASEEFAATEEGAFLQTVRSYAANLEREKIKERTIRGKRSHAKNGTLSFKRPLFGYRLDDTGRRVADDVEANVVRRLFDSVRAGKSLRSTADALNAAEIRTPYNSRNWYSQSVKQIINNPAYCGRTTAFRIKHKKFYRDGRLVHYGSTLADTSEHILMPDVTPPIVTPEEWEAAQLAIRKNSGTRSRTNQKQFLLRGLVRCAACGRMFSPNGRGKWLYYFCTSTQSKSIYCGTRSFRADKYEAEAWQHVTDYINGLTPPEPIAAEDPLAAIDRRMEQLVAERVRIVKRSATMDDKTWALFEKELITKKNELDRLQIERDAIIKQAKKPAVSVEDIRNQYADTLDSLPFEGRTELLKLLGVSCTWDGSNLRVVIA